MTSYTKMAMSGVALLGLTACGGSSSGLSSFESIIDAGTELSATTVVIDFTDPTTLPTSGSATYDGFIGLASATTEDIAGEMTLRATFGNDSISGSATNFFTRGEEAVGGTLQIQNGTIDRTVDTEMDFTFEADVDGTLTTAAGAIVVDGGLFGDFTDTDHRFIEGFIGGTVTQNGTTSALDGEFIGER